MFNFSGSEIVFLLLLALIILGPEKLPEAIRTFGKTYAEFKKVTTGFQSELKSALDEPMREMRETADMFKSAATFDGVADMLDDAKKMMNEAADPASAAAPASAPEQVAAAAEPGDPAAASGAAPPFAPTSETTAEATAETTTETDPNAEVAAPSVASGMVQRMRSLDEIVTREPAVERPAGPAFHSAAPPVRAPEPSPPSEQVEQVEQNEQNEQVESDEPGQATA